MPFQQASRPNAQGSGFESARVSATGFNQNDKFQNNQNVSSFRGRPRGSSRGTSSFGGNNRNQGYNQNQRDGFNQGNQYNQGNDGFRGNNNNRGNNFSNRGSNRSRGTGRGGFNNSRYNQQQQQQQPGYHKSNAGLIFATEYTSFFGEVEDAHAQNQPTSGTTALALWPESSQLFTGGNDGSIKMWDIDGNVLNQQQEGIAIGCLKMVSGWLFVGYTNPGLPGQNAGFVKIYNFNSPQVEINELKISEQFPAAHNAQVRGIEVFNDMVITASEDMSLKAWKMQNNQWMNVGSYGGEFAHTAPITALLCSGDKMLSGSAMGDIKVWNTTAGQLIGTISAHQGAILDIEYWENPEMKVIITCGKDGAIRVWDSSPFAQGSVPTAAIFEYKDSRNKPFSCVTATKLSNGQPVILVGFENGSIQMFDLPAFKEYGYLRGHKRESPITKISKNMNGKIFAGSLAGTLICYEIK